MSSSFIYDFSIVPFRETLQNLLHCLEKAEKHAVEKGEDVNEYLNLRIIDDMKPFTYQIQSLTNTAKATLPRLADLEAVSIEDNEETWADIKERVKKTIEILNTAKPEDFAGKENKEVTLFGGKYKFTAVTYLQTFALPNFYFHATTAYDLLRMKGVPIGKLDYLQGTLKAES